MPALHLVDLESRHPLSELHVAAGWLDSHFEL
jgi:hypothetical protein